MCTQTSHSSDVGALTKRKYADVLHLVQRIWRQSTVTGPKLDDIKMSMLQKSIRFEKTEFCFSFCSCSSFFSVSSALIMHTFMQTLTKFTSKKSSAQHGRSRKLFNDAADDWNHFVATCKSDVHTRDTLSFAAFQWPWTGQYTDEPNRLH